MVLLLITAVKLSSAILSICFMLTSITSRIFYHYNRLTSQAPSPIVVVQLPPIAHLPRLTMAPVSSKPSRPYHEPIQFSSSDEEADKAKEVKKANEPKEANDSDEPYMYFMTPEQADELLDIAVSGLFEPRAPTSKRRQE